MTREQLRNRVAPLLESALRNAEDEALAPLAGISKAAARLAYRTLTSHSALVCRIAIEVATQTLAPQVAILTEEARELFVHDSTLHPAVLQAIEQQNRGF